MIGTLTIGADLLTTVCSGSDALVAYNYLLEETLKHIYGMGGLCLKMFRVLTADQKKRLDLYTWTGATLIEATIVQNVFAIHGLAPFVFGLVLLNNERLAQVTEYADGSGLPDLPLVESLREKYGIKTRTQKHNSGQVFDIRFDANWVGGKLVDFGGWYISDMGAYQRDVLSRLLNAFATNGRRYVIVNATEGIRATREMANILHEWEFLSGAHRE
jgi:hypothetical protein